MYYLILKLSTPYLWIEERLFLCWIIKPKYCPKAKDKKCPIELRRKIIFVRSEESSEDISDQSTVSMIQTPLNWRQNWGSERKDWLKFSSYLKQKFFHFVNNEKVLTCARFCQSNLLILIFSKSWMSIYKWK